MIRALAHQGGWDEILLVLGPVAILAILLWRAARKASAMAIEDGDGANREDADRSEPT